MDSHTTLRRPVPLIVSSGFLGLLSVIVVIVMIFSIISEIIAPQEYSKVLLIAPLMIIFVTPFLVTAILEWFGFSATPGLTLFIGIYVTSAIMGLIGTGMATPVLLVSSVLIIAACALAWLPSSHQFYREATAQRVNILQEWAEIGPRGDCASRLLLWWFRRHH